MDIDSYFEATDDGELRIRGTRVDLSVIVDAWRDGLSAEEIAYNYPSLNLEQVYASLTWYLAHRRELDQAQARREPTPLPAEEAPVVTRLRALLRARSNRPAASR